MKEIKPKLGSDVRETLHQLFAAEEPTFAKFNGVYMYGGCKTPPHEQNVIDKRTWLAGMIMHAMTAPATDITYADKKARAAVMFADSLLRLLNETK